MRNVARIVGGLAVLLSLLVMTGQPAAAAETRVALVIGNGGYHRVQALANPAKDARLIAATLKRLGFSLVGGGPQIDLDREALVGAVAKFRASLTPGSIAFFYYSGHGVQIDGANYLIPVDAGADAAADLVAQAYPAADVLVAMGNTAAAVKIMVLDACRNNPFQQAATTAAVRGLRPGDPSPPPAKMQSGLAEMRAPHGTLISFATQPGIVAFDGPAGGDSPYSAALAHVLGTPGVDLIHVFNRAGVEVGRATGHQQDPWLAIAGLEEDVFLAGGPGAAAPAASPPARGAAPIAPAAAMGDTMRATARPAAGGGLRCPPAGTAVLRSTGQEVRYVGEASPGICVQLDDRGRQLRGFGVWPANWPAAGQADAVFRAVMSGPPGTSRSFNVSQDVQNLNYTTSSQTWQFTLTNAGRGQVMVGGRSRATQVLVWRERNLARPYTGEATVSFDDATGAVISERYAITQGAAPAAYDFWSHFGGGVGAVPDFTAVQIR